MFQIMNSLSINFFKRYLIRIRLATTILKCLLEIIAIFYIQVTKNYSKIKMYFRIKTYKFQNKFKRTINSCKITIRLTRIFKDISRKVK